MTLESFLGIGVSHIDEIGEYSYQLLEEFKPDAITLERGAHFIDNEHGANREKATRARFMRKESKIELIHQRGDSGVRAHHEKETRYFFNIDQVLLNVDGIKVIDTNAIDTFGALLYAVDKNIPFYFVDIPLGNWDFIQFTKDAYNIIRMKHQAVHASSYTLEDLQMVRESQDLELEIRNRFAADAINLIGKRRKRIAHVGGLAHFNVQTLKSDFARWETYDREYQDHLQQFVDAEKILVVDTMTQKRYQFHKQVNEMVSLL